MTSREALLKGLFRRQTEPSPAAQELYETFLKAFNPEKSRFKDRGWQAAFKKQVEEHAEALKQELDRHHEKEDSMVGQFWKAIKKSLVEVSFARTASISSLLRIAAQELMASGGFVWAPRDIKFEKHIILKGHRVRWEGQDFGGQYRVEFKNNRGDPMGALIFENSTEFENEWNVRTANFRLNEKRVGVRFGDFLAALDEQNRVAIPLRNIQQTEKYLGHKIAEGTEDGEWGFDYIERETRIGSSPVLRVIESFNLESEAHGVYMSYSLSPDGKAFYRRALKKYPNYNTDRTEAQKATDMIMKNLATRVRGPQEGLGKVMQRVRSKVLEGIM
jgi:transcription termination factor NusB